MFNLNPRVNEILKSILPFDAKVFYMIYYYR